MREPARRSAGAATRRTAEDSKVVNINATTELKVVL
jgi:hypothetical protein